MPGFSEYYGGIIVTQRTNIYILQRTRYILKIVEREKWIFILISVDTNVTENIHTTESYIC